VSADAWWLYVLECEGGVLYTGIARDVDARFADHKSGKGAAFTRMSPPVRIVAKVPLATRGDALRAEYAFKQIPRVDKLRWCGEGLERFVKTLAP
jgi:putative endonuclease